LQREIRTAWLLGNRSTRDEVRQILLQRMTPLLARFCRERTGRACLLCPGISDVDLFRYREGIIHLNAKVSDGAFDLGVAEQELHSP
jgi:hypothetical protein